METIRKRRNIYAILLCASILLTVWLSMVFGIEATFVVGTISIAVLLLLLKQNNLLYDATLIWDNRILAVTSALISVPGVKDKKHSSEIVLSTFGILVDDKIYRWGLDGLYGVRLSSIEIGKKRLYLTFGDVSETMRVEMLHGMTELQEVMEVAQKLLRETGITAKIVGW